MRGKLIAGRYRVDAPLGTGGMSAVWAAEDTELGRPVAVKVLAQDADPARFEREARAAAALAHPNVVRLFDFGKGDDGPFIVFELLTGGSLEERLDPGRPLPDAETERIARAVAAGLAHAHAAGLVHRDLKPANILFDAEDRPKISDFGIAKMEGGGTLTDTGTVIATALTIAPEQTAAETATPATDVYSFGVILYRMLAGRFPFESAEPLALAMMHAHETPPPLADARADVPARLGSLAMAALAKDPADRPSDGAALVRGLDGGTTVTRALATVVPRGSRIPPRALALAAAAVAVAAGGAAVAVLATRSTEEQPPPAPADTTPRPPATPDETATEAPQQPATTEETTTRQQTTAQQTTAQQTTAPTTEPVPTTLPTTIETETLPTTTTDGLP